MSSSSVDLAPFATVDHEASARPISRAASTTPRACRLGSTPGSSKAPSPSSSSSSAPRSTSAPTMADWADLTSTVRRTKGECPPPLVGASVTLVGDSIYVFGGRPVHSREMVNSLHALDLRSLAWTQLWPPCPGSTMSRGPAPRYFHSAQAWGDKLVVFGGQTFVAGPGPASQGPPGADSPQGGAGGRLETLDELVIFDTKSRTWSFPSPSLASGVSRPSPRYAHLSVVTAVASRPSPGFREPSRHSSRLVVIGGQDYENNYLPDLAVLDLEAMEWVAEAPYPRKAGTYRSVAASAAVSIVPREERMASDGTVLVHSAHSVEPTEDREEPVWVYSNSNFASPRRDLDLIPTVHDSVTTPAYVSVSDAMEGDPTLPPGLRFPHAYLCGRHLVLSGAHVGVNRAEFVVWSLDLGAHDPLAPGRAALPWSALPLEKVLGRGSWGPAVGWRNTLVVLGDASRDMMEDYNARQTNFGQVAFVDLEGFGVFVPPHQPIPAVQQQLSLLTMSQPQLFDFEIICSDRERLGCSRKLLEARWPWLAEELRAVEHKAHAAVEAREQHATTDSGAYGSSDDEEPIDGAMSRVSSPVPPRRPSQQISSPAPSRAPSRLFPITSRSLELPLPSSDVKALLQYFHTLALSTQLQRSLPVLTSLLAFTKTYDSVLPSLRALVVHAFHETLDMHPETGAKAYEAAALGDSVALQIRAMQVMLNVRRGSAASTAQSVEAKRTASNPEPRLSDMSQASSMSNLSHFTGFDNDSSLPYNRSSGGSSSASSLVNTTASGPTYVSPLTSTTPVPPHALPPLPHSAPSSKNASPNLSLPVTAGSPLFGSNSRSPSAFPPRHGSLSAASSRSTPSPIPPAAPLPPPPQEQLRRASSPTMSMSMGISSSTPARIAEAWREGEERDRRQRAEAARLAAEADLARSTAAMRLGLGPGPGPADLAARRGSFAASEGSGGGGGRKGSVASEAGSGRKGSVATDMSRKGSVASANTLDSIPESVGSYGPLNGALNGGGFASNATPSLGSGSCSVRAAVAAAAAQKAAETTAKVVKKGLFSGFMGPTIHNAGTTKKGPTGPAPKRAYPRPTPKTAKGAQALARLDDQFEQGSSSSSSSFRS
ncbi:hypothetical protein DMC30DRAFT_173860 [Rhodotorula diobovata]|uniref:Regulatory protein ral2 n=1 Tax=Rhodotorula diobovata TaxID=5288 RepID=A0A5C5FYT7_9BASI|nr:hypothetical protein DMC30DRAFT_173860 [Rhodotorula diobovata]